MPIGDRTGRRPGPNRTRGAILAAARGAFSQRGYDAVSVRSIAKDAGVDPALVHRFFGGKESLFAAAMELPVAPGELVRGLLEGGVENLGARIVTAMLAVYDSAEAFAPLQALLRGATSNERAAKMLREFVTVELLGPVAAAAAPDRPRLRAALAGSQLLGLLFARYVVRLGPLAEAEAPQLAAIVGPKLDSYLTGPLPDTVAEAGP